MCNSSTAKCAKRKRDFCPDLGTRVLVASHHRDSIIGGTPTQPDPVHRHTPQTSTRAPENFLSPEEGYLAIVRTWLKEELAAMKGVLRKMRAA